METLELFEIVNLLPYNVIEEALEYDYQELMKEFSNKQTRCRPGLRYSQKPGLESLITNINIEEEVEREVKRMMKSNSLYDALIGSLHAASINDLLINAVPSISTN